ncbi:hypothetical protein F4861DRAFT_509389 [Xylaria intraflava]|nr:hypothetical protein F4861DRAFT_509389 [Xylaria intraflava]
MSPNHLAEGNRRHIACQKCRQRKVKCDGRQPYCKRCARGGAAWDCFYDEPALQRRKISQPAILDVQEVNSPEHTTGQDGDDGKSEHEDVIEGASLSCSINFNTLSDTPALDKSAVDKPGIRVQQRGSVSSTSSIGPDACSQIPITENLDMDDLVPDLLQSSTCLGSIQPLNLASTIYETEIGLSSSVMEMLLLKYIETCQSPYFVFQDQTRLLLLMLEPSDDCVALKYALCALVMSANHEFSLWDRSHEGISQHVADQGALLYEAAKGALARYKADHPSQSPSLRVLQTTILLGLYELHSADFSQAWSTISRAIWITQSLKLHFLDTYGSFSPLPEEDIDDARIAFWATSGLAAFLSLNGRVFGASEVPSHVPLSNPGFYVPGISAPSQLTMADIFSRKATRQLMVQEALCACGVLLPRIITHVRTVDGVEDAISQPYNFWTNHQRFRGTICYINSLTKNACEAEPALEMLLNAFSIILHEAVRKKKQGSSVRNLSSQAWSAENAAVQHAIQISKVVQTQPSSKDNWARITGTWALYVALKSLLQHQQRAGSGEGCSDAHIQLGSDFRVWSSNSDRGASDPIPASTPGSGCFELFPDAPALLSDALMLDSITALRVTLVERSRSTPLAAFFLSRVDVETSALNDRLYDDVLGVVDFTASPPFL